MDLTTLAEWLESKLGAAHKKWESITTEVDTRALDHILGKRKRSADDGPELHSQTRVAKRIFQDGGTLQSIERKMLQVFKKKLANNSWDSPDEKKEYFTYLESLKPEEIKVLDDPDWV